MIKPPSQIHEYSIIFSGDSALNLPVPEAARERALSVARETGQWDPLLLAGESPTVFHVVPIHGAALDWLTGEMQRNGLIGAEAAALALRLALRSIDGFGEHKVKMVREDGHLLASMETINALYAIDVIGRDVVQEIGGVCFERAFSGLRPKS